MNFIDALGHLYHNRISDEEFSDPFFLYCRLSDLCSSSYEDKRKVLLFFKIDKKISLANAVAKKDNSIDSRYAEVKDLLSEASFKRLINSVKCAMFPEYKMEEMQKPQQQPKKKVVVVQKSENIEQSKTKTTLVSNVLPQNNQYKKDSSLLIGILVSVGIFFAIASLITLACVFAWSWTFWQWFIGTAGGLLIVGILWIISFFVCDEFYIEGFVAGTVILGICIGINLILMLIFKSNYRIIFRCFSVLEILFGIMLCFYTIFEDDIGCFWVQVIESVLALILIIFI